MARRALLFTLAVLFCLCCPGCSFSGHKDSFPSWRLIGVWNTGTIGMAPEHAVLHLVQRIC